jgi:hypothetical protein
MRNRHERPSERQFVAAHTEHLSSCHPKGNAKSHSDARALLCNTLGLPTSSTASACKVWSLQTSMRTSRVLLVPSGQAARWHSPKAPNTGAHLNNPQSNERNTPNFKQLPCCPVAEALNGSQLSSATSKSAPRVGCSEASCALVCILWYTGTAGCSGGSAAALPPSFKGCRYGRGQCRARYGA